MTEKNKSFCYLWPSFSSTPEEDVNDWQDASLRAPPGYRWTTDTEDVSADVALTDKAAWAGTVAKTCTNLTFKLNA